MSVTKQQHHRMTVAEFLGWSKDDPQRYEPAHGEVLAMAPTAPPELGLAGLYRDIEFETEFPKGQRVAAGGH